jgi:hypothetical protein
LGGKRPVGVQVLLREERQPLRHDPEAGGREHLADRGPGEARLDHQAEVGPAGHRREQGQGADPSGGRSEDARDRIAYQNGRVWEIVL